MSTFNHSAPQDKTHLSATQESASERLMLPQASLAFHKMGRHVLILTFAFLSILAYLAAPRSGFSQGNPHKTRIDGELVTILPTGFEPKTLTRPMGKFFLFVDNRSGLDSVTVRLDPVTGNRLVDVTTPRAKLDSVHFLDLTPGTYKLTEAAHPQWLCTITVTAH